MGWFDSKKPTPEEIKAAQERMNKRTTRLKLGSETEIDRQKPLGGDMSEEEINKKNKEKR